MISCAPVSYDFVLRQRCSTAFCLAGLSHGSQTSLFSSSLFMWPCVNETSLQLLWCDLVIYPWCPMAEGLTCSVNCVFDTISQFFHRGRLCAEGRLRHCGKQWLLLSWIKGVLERVFMILQEALEMIRILESSRQLVLKVQIK